MKAEDGRRKETPASSSSTHPSALRVAIVGGGWAGLAAAVTLAQRGVPLTLFEAARQLGGRARRVDCCGLPLDNGQHILLGAYHQTLRLIGLAGGAPADALLLRLPLRLAVPGRFELRTPPLPAPLHLLAGLLTARGLSLSERFGALRFMHALQRQNFRLEQDGSVAALLARHDQNGNLVRLLWEPLCLAALNTPIEAASAAVFLNVLRDSFSRSRADSDLLLPQADLSAVFPDLAAAFVENRGGRIRLGEPVRSLRLGERGIFVTSASSGESFSHAIIAVPPQRLPGLLGELPLLAEAARLASGLTCQPIYTVYLQYPASACLPCPMLGLAGGFAQWAFDRGRTHGTPGLLAAVISAEGNHQRLSHDELALQIERELRETFNLPPPLWHKVIAEKRATFSCLAGLERPGQTTPAKNLYLAGDYTAGDYPATLEGAVQSGIKCANLILDGIQ